MDLDIDPVARRADHMYECLVGMGYNHDDSWEFIKSLALGGYFNYIRKPSDR